MGSQYTTGKKVFYIAKGEKWKTKVIGNMCEKGEIKYRLEILEVIHSSSEHPPEDGIEFTTSPGFNESWKLEDITGLCV